MVRGGVEHGSVEEGLVGNGVVEPFVFGIYWD